MSDIMVPNLNSNGDMIAAAFKETESPKTFIPLLSEHKSLVLIFKPVMGEGVQVTSFHTPTDHPY